jgi:hypothetical protein
MQAAQLTGPIHEATLISSQHLHIAGTAEFVGTPSTLEMEASTKSKLEREVAFRANETVLSKMGTDLTG